MIGQNYVGIVEPGGSCPVADFGRFQHEEVFTPVDTQHTTLIEVWGNLARKLATKHVRQLGEIHGIALPEQPGQLVELREP